MTTVLTALVVVLGALALTAVVVWAVRDVARYRIDVATQREREARAQTLDARFDEIGERLTQIERATSGLGTRPRRA